MLQQVHRSPRAFQGRVQRFRQPQIKEERKQRIPKDVVLMLDGTHCTIKNFNDLRSVAPKRLKDEFTGIAQRIRLAVGDSGDSWGRIIDWIDAHRPKRGTVAHQNDALVAAAIAYASSRFKRPASEIIADICKNGSRSVLFPVTQ